MFDTGAGFKSVSPDLPPTRPIPNDPDYWKDKIVPALKGR